MKQQFKTFAHGLFQYMHDPEGLWAPALVLAQDDIEYPYDENLEPEIRDDDLPKILNYPLGTDRLDFDAYTPAPRAKKVATRPAPALRTLLGTWNGFTYSQRGLSLLPSPVDVRLTKNRWDRPILGDAFLRRKAPSDLYRYIASHIVRTAFGNRKSHIRSFCTKSQHVRIQHLRRMQCPPSRYRQLFV